MTNHGAELNLRCNMMFKLIKNMKQLDLKKASESKHQFRAVVLNRGAAAHKGAVR